MVKLETVPVLTREKINEYRAYCEKNSLISSDPTLVMTQKQIDTMAEC